MIMTPGEAIFSAIGGSNKEERVALVLDALSSAGWAFFHISSPPLPEADGEVVAWMRTDLILGGHDFLRDKHHAERSAAFRYEGRPAWEVEPLVRQSALVSVLRERDEARALAETYREARERYRKERDAERTAKLSERAAREKAEQVAAGLRQAHTNVRARLDEMPVETKWRSVCIDTIDAALRASAEEGKTATPPVKEEEAGRG